MSHEPERDQVPSRPWWAFPPLRDSLLAGLIAGSAFVLERFGLLRADVAVWPYLISIPLGGRHWMREGLEKLVEEHAISIEALMASATAASAILRMWEEAAALMVVFEGSCARRLSKSNPLSTALVSSSTNSSISSSMGTSRTFALVRRRLSINRYRAIAYTQGVSGWLRSYVCLRVWTAINVS
jgi:hypothetical protein